MDRIVNEPYRPFAPPSGRYVMRDPGGGGWISGLIMIVVVVLIFTALIGTIQTSVNNANLTNTAADTMLVLVPLFLVVALVLLIVGWATKGRK